VVSRAADEVRPRARPAPVLVLGVARSGTRLLKEMLTSHSELAIPDESYFIPAVWARHGARVRTERLIADLDRFELAPRPGATADELRRRLPAEADFADAIHAIYQGYAEAQGKGRYGNKTPEYMQHLGLLDRAFPGARYVHIVRDGRDAAVSWVSMSVRRSAWRWPRTIAGFAYQWRSEIVRAQRFGRSLGAGRYHELRYEDLVFEPESRLRELCAFLELPFESAMLEYHRRLDPGVVPNHPRLLEPPIADLRDWRLQMGARDLERFEAIAGDTLSRLGYERAFPAPSRRARARATVGAVTSSVRAGSWKVFGALWRRTPAWRARPI
jgi:hypothetical protein